MNLKGRRQKQGQQAKNQNKIMEISIYSTIDFSKARNLLTERQKNVKAFNPIVPEGGCISFGLIQSNI